MALTEFPSDLSPLAEARARQRTHSAALGSEDADFEVGSYLAWLTARGRQPSTIYNYAACLASFIDACASVRSLSEVEPAHVQEWLARPRGGRAGGNRGSAATISRDATIVRTFYRWLQAMKLVTHNPVELVAVPTVRNRQPRAIDDEVWLKAWRFHRADDRAVAVLGLGFLCGLRRAEIVALRSDHLQGGRIVSFPRKGGVDDIFPLVEVLDVWSDFLPTLLDGARARFEEAIHSLGEPGGFLFEGWQTRSPSLRGLEPSGLAPSPDAVNRLLKRWLTDAGMPGAFSPHALRHSFVTNLLRAGMPIEMVSDLASHSELNVTLRYVRGGGGRVEEWRQGALARLGGTATTAGTQAIADRFGISR
jgi:site-specific recombinase XerD